MRSTKVLVVDDDRNFARSLMLLLNTKGFDADVAHNGTEAIEKFSTQHYDIAFMDVRMPGKSGVESFLEIRRLKPDAKVMMMTAYTVEQVLNQVIEAGALGVLHKPLDPEMVFEAVEAAKPGGIVLVADDDPNFAESTRQFLSQRGYMVLVVNTGREAVDTVLETGADVLILDLRLPVLSGLDVYLELKKLGKTLPTVIVTGYASEEESTIDVLSEMSITGCLHKPFDPEQLVDAIENFLDAPE